MSKIPQVSVIIPIYNAEKYLVTCIGSVLEQTYENLEILLVDDGSQDNSGKICERYAQEDSRIKVIHQENQGLASARNRGFEQSGGEYIYFIDSDDCLHRDLLTIAVRLAEEKGAGIVQINYKNVPESFSEYRDNEVKPYQIFEFSVEQALKNLEIDCKEYARDIRMTTMVAWSKLYKRDVLASVRFTDGVRIHEDQLAAHRFIIQAGGMVFCNAELYYYRTIEESLSRKQWKKAKLFIIECYKDRLKSVMELNEKGGYQDIVDLVYKRYLVCILRNYVMVERYLQGEEKKQVKGELLCRMKTELAHNYGRLLFKDKVLMHIFMIFPSIFVWMYSKSGRV